MVLLPSLLVPFYKSSFYRVFYRADGAADHSTFLRGLDWICEENQTGFGFGLSETPWPLRAPIFYREY